MEQTRRPTTSGCSGTRPLTSFVKRLLKCDIPLCTWPKTSPQCDLDLMLPVLQFLEIEIRNYWHKWATVCNDTWVTIDFCRSYCLKRDTRLINTSTRSEVITQPCSSTTRSGQWATRKRGGQDGTAPLVHFWLLLRYLSHSDNFASTTLHISTRTVLVHSWRKSRCSTICTSTVTTGSCGLVFRVSTTGEQYYSLDLLGSHVFSPWLHQYHISSISVVSASSLTWKTASWSATTVW